MEDKLFWIFSCSDYRTGLRMRQEELKHRVGKQFSKVEFAKAMNIHRPYLSKVLSGNADLSEDQLFFAIRFLGFSDVEKTYLELLHRYQRTGVESRKREILTKLEVLKSEHLRADKQLETRLIKIEEELHYSAQNYFLDPIAQLVHMFLTVEKYRTRHKEILNRLKLSDDDWSRALELLAGLDLIALDRDGIKILKDHVLLSKDSTLFSTYHQLLKVYALGQLSRVPVNDKTSFSVIYTCSNITGKKIRLKLIELIKNIEGLVKDDPSPTEVYQFSVDLFPWSETDL